MSPTRSFQRFSCADSRERNEFSKKALKEIMRIDQFFKTLKTDDKVFLLNKKY